MDSRQLCEKKEAVSHFVIIPAAGNESLLAIPYLTSRSAYGQSTDPLRTAGTKVMLQVRANSINVLSIFRKGDHIQDI